MRDHIRILAWLNIVMGGIMLLAAVAILLMFVAAGHFAGGSENGGLAIFGTFIFLVCAVMGLPSLMAGIGLLNLSPWARILTIVVSVFDLPNFPLGTGIGAYGLWVLFNPETVALFEQ